MNAARKDLLYRLEGHFTRIEMIGPVADGIRMNSHFAGPVTAGEYRGAQIVGVDHFRIRRDGIGVVNAQEVMVVDGHRVAVEVHGYVLPPPPMPPLTAEQVTSPDFAWPDLPFTIEAYATFQTAAPELAALNAVIVAHTGSANLGSGDLFVEARRLTQARLPRVAGTPRVDHSAGARRPRGPALL